MPLRAMAGRVDRRGAPRTGQPLPRRPAKFPSACLQLLRGIPRCTGTPRAQRGFARMRWTVCAASTPHADALGSSWPSILRAPGLRQATAKKEHGHIIDKPGCPSRLHHPRLTLRPAPSVGSAPSQSGPVDCSGLSVSPFSWAVSLFLPPSLSSLFRCHLQSTHTHTLSLSVCLFLAFALSLPGPWLPLFTGTVTVPFTLLEPGSIALLSRSFLARSRKSSRVHRSHSWFMTAPDLLRLRV